MLCSFSQVMRQQFNGTYSMYACHVCARAMLIYANIIKCANHIPESQTNLDMS